jgi:hypothetical protein
MSVDTARVQGRRKLDYASLDEVVTDAERLSSGTIKTLGNWSPGQIFRHLAIAYNGSIDGFPPAFPWFMRMIGKALKRVFMKNPMPAGLKLPPKFAAVVLPSPTTTEEGLAELRLAVARLARESERAEHPIFGKISKEEWNSLHLKHANLHMGYLIPE